MLRPTRCILRAVSDALHPTSCVPRDAAHAMRPTRCGPRDTVHALHPPRCAPRTALYVLRHPRCATRAASHALRPTCCTPRAVPYAVRSTFYALPYMHCAGIPLSAPWRWAYSHTRCALRAAPTHFSLTSTHCRCSRVKAFDIPSRHRGPHSNISVLFPGIWHHFISTCHLYFHFCTE